MHHIPCRDPTQQVPQASRNPLYLLLFSEASGTAWVMKVGIWILKAATLKMAVFWAVAPCRKIFLLMEAESTSETSVKFHQTARSKNPEDSHLHARPIENLNYCSAVIFVVVEQYAACEVQLEFRVLFPTTFDRGLASKIFTIQINSY
jgi:hypothetical protein